jgi:hypothetical protein
MGYPQMTTNGTSGVGMVAIKTLTNNIRNSNGLPDNTATALETLQDNNNSLNQAVGRFNAIIATPPAPQSGVTFNGSPVLY